ncbi:peroxisome biogenesis protein 5, partial [Tanacetum coccineum]
NDVGSNVFASDIRVVVNVATRECTFDYPPDALINVSSQPSFMSTVATSTSMMPASDSVSMYGLQRADWMVYLTPAGNQEYTEMCFSVTEDAKLLGYTYTPDAFKGVYEFSDLNPFAGHLDPMREGHELFRKGLLSEAVLALDAEVLRNPDNAEGSPMLMVTEMTKHIRVRASRGKTTPSEVG